MHADPRFLLVCFHKHLQARLGNLFRDFSRLLESAEEKSQSVISQLSDFSGDGGLKKGEGLQTMMCNHEQIISFLYTADKEEGA